MPANKLTEADRKAIAGRYLMGEDPKDLATAYGVSERTIYRIIDKLDASRRDKPVPPPKALPPRTTPRPDLRDKGAPPPKADFANYPPETAPAPSDPQRTDPPPPPRTAATPKARPERRQTLAEAEAERIRQREAMEASQRRQARAAQTEYPPVSPGIASGVGNNRTTDLDDAKEAALAHLPGNNRQRPPASQRAEYFAEARGGMKDWTNRLWWGFAGVVVVAVILGVAYALIPPVIGHLPGAGQWIGSTTEALRDAFDNAPPPERKPTEAEEQFDALPPALQESLLAEQDAHRERTGLEATFDDLSPELQQALLDALTAPGTATTTTPTLTPAPGCNLLPLGCRPQPE